MPKRSKLLQALDDHKGRDYDAEKQKKQVKAAEKRKRAKKGTDDEEEEEEVEMEKDDEEKVCDKLLRQVIMRFSFFSVQLLTKFERSNRMASTRTRSQILRKQTGRAMIPVTTMKRTESRRAKTRTRRWKMTTATKTTRKTKKKKTFLSPTYPTKSAKM